MNRRLFVAVLVAALSLSSCTTPDTPSTGHESRGDESRVDESRPNVLIIVTDDQPVGDTLKVMPDTRRWFQKNGTRFTRAFVTTPACCPSRASIFTGRYAHNHGVTTNSASSNLDQSTTLQYYLRAAGYRTGIFGKYFNRWGMNPPYFDEWAIHAGRRRYYGGVWNVDGTRTTIDRNSTSYISRKAVSFLEEGERTADTKPWFLYIAPHAPHSPFTPRSRYSSAPVDRWLGNPGVYERNLRDKPRYVRRRTVKSSKAASIRRQQLRTLYSVDDMVEAVFGALDDLGERRETLAFFLSDNGYLWGEHGLRGKISKATPYTQSINVPFLMHWRGARGTDARLVANIDIAPTVLDAAEISPAGRPAMDGTSLLDTSWTRSRLLTEYQFFRAHPHVPTWASIRTDSDQYVEYYGADGQTVTFREYYDLESDPWQLRNLLGDDDTSNDPDVAALSRRLAADRACVGARCP